MTSSDFFAKDVVEAKSKERSKQQARLGMGNSCTGSEDEATTLVFIASGALASEGN
jgi:hypothetical protein